MQDDLDKFVMQAALDSPLTYYSETGGDPISVEFTRYKEERTTILDKTFEVTVSIEASCDGEPVILLDNGQRLELLDQRTYTLTPPSKGKN